VVKQLDNRQTLAASRLQPATAAAVQVHMHPKLGVSSAQLPAVNDALPTKAGNLVVHSNPKVAVVLLFLPAEAGRAILSSH